MSRLALLLIAGLAAPAGAEEAGPCRSLWDRLSAALSESFPVSGTVTADAQGCVVADVRLDYPGDYTPDWVADELRLSGGALGWLAGDAAAVPDRLEVLVRGLRFELRSGMALTDYVFAAQARANTIDADLALAWDPAARMLAIERLAVDFPGQNELHLTAQVTGLDLSSPGAAQMSLASAALREADLVVRTHGLFEGLLLNALATALLPLEGNMEAEVAALKAQATAAVAALPEASFPGESRAALAALIAELPNPKGRLTLAFRADPGLGATRFAGYAPGGAPDTLEAAAPLLDGVTVEIGWSHEDDR